jgi:hypothetical protein
MSVSFLLGVEASFHLPSTEKVPLGFSFFEKSLILSDCTKTEGVFCALRQNESGCCDDHTQQPK